MRAADLAPTLHRRTEGPCETLVMLVLRGTKKLRDRIKGPVAKADDTSSTVLGDWFATALFWKPQVALLVNQRTLLPVFMPLAPAATLVGRVPEAIATALRNQGASEAFIAAELAAMGEVRIATTNDRSTRRRDERVRLPRRVPRPRGTHRPRSTQLPHVVADPRAAPPPPRLTGPRTRRRAAQRPVERRRTPPTCWPRPQCPAPATRRHVFQLKVTLLGIKPPVWRRIVVHASTSLDRLHEYIQAAFGWWNYHLYEFEIDRKRYGIPDPDDDYGPPSKNAHRTKLGNVADVGDSFTYTYDFGDGWDHKITVEKSLPIAPGMTVPACTDGRRACPPEDCGGPVGLRGTAANPRRPFAPRARGTSACGPASGAAASSTPRHSTPASSTTTSTSSATRLSTEVSVTLPERRKAPSGCWGLRSPVGEGGLEL